GAAPPGRGVGAPARGAAPGGGAALPARLAAGGDRQPPGPRQIGRGRPAAPRPRQAARVPPSTRPGRTMNGTSPDNTGRDARLNEVIAGYLEAVEAGRAPEREAWLAQHPDLADDLRAFLANHDRMAQVGAPLAGTGVRRSPRLGGADPGPRRNAYRLVR